jgi:regulator of sigma E protease
VSPDLLSSLLSNVWSVFLVVLFFGGSIFVHELGHFLAARRRGVHVERFSIGFGPPIWSWRGKDGVEYRLAWFPLGGYVLLPQLADLGALEGESRTDVSKLPPVGYVTKMLVFVAGAVFNVLFAFLLATIVWMMGQPESSDSATTKIGYIIRKIQLPNGTEVDSPAFRAGVQVGDTILAIDGDRVSDWDEIRQSLALGSGRSASGDPQVVLTVERAGKKFDITAYPVLAGPESMRQIGVAAAYELIVHKTEPGSLGEKIGFLPNDELLRLDDVPILNAVTYRDVLDAKLDRPVTALVRRNGQEAPLTIPARPGAKPGDLLGLTFRTGMKTVHIPPHEQIADVIRWTGKTLKSLVNRHSNVGIENMSSVVGIVRILYSAAEVGIRPVLMITILLNVNLALLNLLPIPILDGGQMMFATLAKLRGRPLPFNFMMTAQSVFFVLLISLVLYVSVFDVKRAIRDAKDRAAENMPKATAPAK